jgi:predicted dehydrogenase
MERRVFLMCGAGVLAAQVPPSTRIVLGLIGAGRRGMQLLNALLADPSLQIGAVCETYEPRMFEAVALARARGHHSRFYRLYGDLLSDKSLDAVVIATPDFWHCRMTVEALEHGKDVYVEQPLCRTWQEGVAMIAAQSRSNRIVQVGLQARSNPVLSQMAARLRGGEIGAIQRIEARAAASYLRPRALQRGPTKLPDPLNFEDWQAGAETRAPYSPDRFLNWRYYSTYCGGCVTDLGCRLVDRVHMAGGIGYPVSVFASGTMPVGTTFDTAERAQVEIEYAGGILASVAIDGRSRRCVDDALFYGDRRRMRVNAPMDTTWRHLAHFVQCVRGRMAPNAPPQSVFPAALVCHMANLSITTGRKLYWRSHGSVVEIDPRRGQ